jgi:CubicO group peptidase (beta-lactamase class C family)
VIPAATVSATARDLARFYQSLLDDDSWRQVTTPTSDGEKDRVTGSAAGRGARRTSARSATR